MSNSPPGLVIFDCDGVLVDTETVANRLLASILTGEGFAITYEECRRRFVGGTLEHLQSEVEAGLGRKLGADWCDGLRAKTKAAFAEGIDSIPGVRSQIERLVTRGCPFCVASSGNLSKMRLTLGQTGLLPLLSDVLFSAEMVGRGKPWPDLFLFAAEKMGVPPSRAVVIEDSVFGVQAGISAGMQVLGYAADPHTDDDALEAAGATVFHSMEDLPRLLEVHGL